MIIELDILPTDTVSFDVDVLNTFSFQYKQKVDYIKVANGKTRAYNYGSLSDKWSADITIQSDNLSMESISRYFLANINQCKITCESQEQIFGAGIDYSQDIYCNIINSSRSYSQNDIALSSIKIKLETVKYEDDTQLKYKEDITAGLPEKLNFQTPVDRKITIKQTPFQSENFGSYGVITEVNEEPTNSQEFSIVFDQNEAEQAKIEKFVSVQRSTPFVFSQANYVYLFEDQDTENLMITGMISTRTSHNHWRTTLKMVNNV
jgi:hypothetical protein